MLGKTEGRRRMGWQRWDGSMASWLKGHGFEQTEGDGEGWGSLARCSPWGHIDMSERLNTTKWFISCDKCTRTNVAIGKRLTLGETAWRCMGTVPSSELFCKSKPTIKPLLKTKKSNCCAHFPTELFTCCEDWQRSEKHYLLQSSCGKQTAFKNKEGEIS